MAMSSFLTRGMLVLLEAWPVVGWARQPAVGPASNEPDWSLLLDRQFNLDMDRDLRNPVLEGASPAGLFKQVDAKQPVTFKPLIAFGLETKTQGGWYPAGPKAGDLPRDVLTIRKLLWAYTFKNSVDETKADQYAEPPLDLKTISFNPGDQPFGLWVANVQFDDGGVYTQPALVNKVNARLRSQPYKAMIYPRIDTQTHLLIPNSYIIGWEYSNNDDFQDVVTQIDNVVLLPADPPLPGIAAPEAEVRKLAGEFKFVEGPAWDFKHNALYFSDIPPARIMRYTGSRVTVALENSQQSNGLMFDRDGNLIACEHGGRRVSRGQPGKLGADIVTHYKNKRLNSPNDLWIDAEGGIYFTDPRYGKSDDLEQDKEAVYYLASDGTVRRIIDELKKPNGIALSPDGKNLYVIDNRDNLLCRYQILTPGTIGPIQRIALVDHPDGMTVDIQGRLYITSRFGISVFDRNGKWIGLLSTPEQPANCTFGGPGWHTLFITARTSLYAVSTLTRGWHVHLDGPPSSEAIGTQPRP